MQRIGSPSVPGCSLERLDRICSQIIVGTLEHFAHLS